MGDWKENAKRIAAELERQRLEEIERRRNEPELRRQQAAMEHLSHLKCRICGVKATKPRRDFNDEGIEIINWFLPGDLDLCKICNKWACKKHIVSGICQKCAKKL